MSQNTEKSGWGIVITLAGEYDYPWHSTVKAVFNAKRVSLDLLNRLSDLKALHQASWSDVELAVPHQIEEFNFYFNFVNEAALKLYTQWKINTP